VLLSHPRQWLCLSCRPVASRALHTMLPQSKDIELREHERPWLKKNYGAIRVAAAVPFNTVGAIPSK
jgi:hypothetical protein